MPLTLDLGMIQAPARIDFESGAIFQDVAWLKAGAPARRYLIQMEGPEKRIEQLDLMVVRGYVSGIGGEIAQVGKHLESAWQGWKFVGMMSAELDGGEF
jgi:hypothetical protein